MTSSANSSLVVTTGCVNCGQVIELVLLNSETTGKEFTFWRHVVTGMYGCYLSGREQMAENNLASPNWGEAPTRYLGYQSTDCASGCCYNALKDECVNPDCTCHTYR